VGGWGWVWFYSTMRKRKSPFLRVSSPFSPEVCWDRRKTTPSVSKVDSELIQAGRGFFLSFEAFPRREMGSHS